MSTKKNYCTFYIVRHGETEWNMKGLVQGHADSPLTENGVTQAKALSKELNHITFNKVYSSDLLRAKRTAEIIALERKLAVEATQALRERKFGKYEGTSAELLRTLDVLTEKMSHQELFSYKHAHDINSDEELVTLLIPFLREVAVAHPNKTILIVTHGGTIRAFFIHLGIMSYNVPYKGSVGNLAYTKLYLMASIFSLKKRKAL